VLRNKKVMMAMSGGVDSSAAAVLLKEKGCEVIGVYMKLFNNDDNLKILNKASEDAKKAADDLEIPFYEFNFSDIFKKRVIDYFMKEYLKGRTPNPCIECNYYLKFDCLLKQCKKLNIDFLATGHYAKVKCDKNSNRFLLSKAVDQHKDQSYFLYKLKQEQLSKIIFPLGGYTKTEIRKIAEETGLVTAEKPESQEICFIPNDDYRTFINNRAEKAIKPGPILDTGGNKVGIHKGIPFYTIGQRKGLGLALGYPAYVIDINVNNNAIIVGKKEDIFSKMLVAGDVNYIMIKELKASMDVDVKIRYKALPERAVIYPISQNKVKIIFNKPVKSVTPGQSAVFYLGENVIGGGIIEKDCFK
jgi:tRNA-specific 2-thiouridylase